MSTLSSHLKMDALALLILSNCRVNVSMNERL